MVVAWMQIAVITLESYRQWVDTCCCRSCQTISACSLAEVPCTMVFHFFHVAFLNLHSAKITMEDQCSLLSGMLVVSVPKS